VGLQPRASERSRASTAGRRSPAEAALRGQQLRPRWPAPRAARREQLGARTRRGRGLVLRRRASSTTPRPRRRGGSHRAAGPGPLARWRRAPRASQTPASSACTRPRAALAGWPEVEPRAARAAPGPAGRGRAVSPAGRPSRSRPRRRRSPRHRRRAHGWPGAAAEAACRQGGRSRSPRFTRSTRLSRELARLRRMFGGLREAEPRAACEAIRPGTRSQVMPPSRVARLLARLAGLARQLRRRGLPRIFRMLNPADRQGSGPGTAQRIEGRRIGSALRSGAGPIAFSAGARLRMREHLPP
jgi:hypothetical protein